MHDKAAANRELLCRFPGCPADADEPCPECRCCYCNAHMDHANHVVVAAAETTTESETARGTTPTSANLEMGHVEADVEEEYVHVEEENVNQRCKRTANGVTAKRGQTTKKRRALTTHHSSDDDESDSDDEDAVEAPSRSRGVAAVATVSICASLPSTRASRPPPRQSAVICNSRNSALNQPKDYEKEPNLLYGSQVHRFVV